MNYRIIYFLLLVTAFLFNGCDRCDRLSCSNGECQDGSCICEEGYYGKQCEKEYLCLTRVVDCEENGACLNGRCQCETGYSGQYCENEDRCITEAPDCQNGGVCVEGVCDCPDLYTGEFCETYDECAPIDCKYDRPCNNGECVCNSYTSGEFCENKLVDKHIALYEGWWSCTGPGLNLQRDGTLDVRSSSNAEVLNGDADGPLQNHTLTLSFNANNLDFFAVLAVGNQKINDGHGQFLSQNRVSLEYTYERFNGDLCTCKFDSN